MPSRSKELQLVIDESMEWAERLPLLRRASLYRALAEFCGDQQEAADFRARAADLESVDRRCKQLQLSLKFGGDQ
jgi:hypothetical protein